MAHSLIKGLKYKFREDLLIFWHVCLKTVRAYGSFPVVPAVNAIVASTHITTAAPSLNTRGKTTRVVILSALALGTALLMGWIPDWLQQGGWMKLLNDAPMKEAFRQLGYVGMLPTVCGAPLVEEMLFCWPLAASCPFVAFVAVCQRACTYTTTNPRFSSALYPVPGAAATFGQQCIGRLPGSVYEGRNL